MSEQPQDEQPQSEQREEIEPLSLFDPREVFGPSGRDLVASANGLIGSAAHRQSRLTGEDLRYAVSMTVLPGQQPNTFVPMLVIVVTAPGMTIGERAMFNALSADIHLSEEMANEIVSQAVSSIIEQRRRSTADFLGARQNGNGPHPH